MTGEVELELAEVVLVVEEIGTLSTLPDPPPQETIRNVPIHAKQKLTLLLRQLSRIALGRADLQVRGCLHWKAFSPL